MKYILAFLGHCLAALIITAGILAFFAFCLVLAVGLLDTLQWIVFLE